MESLVMMMEERAMNELRRSSYNNNNSGNMYGYYNNYNNIINNSNYSAFASVSSMDQLLVNANKMPLYFSLPPPVHHQIQRQPPLLPLPIKSATLPPAIRKIGGSPPGAPIGRDQKRRRKKIARGLVGPKTIKEAEMRKAGAPRPAMEEEDTEEEFLIGMPAPAPAPSSVYSVSSPPPSSLPLPRLLLRRARPAKAVAGSCVAEAMVDSAGTAAADDLRRMLRL